MNSLNLLLSFALLLLLCISAIQSKQHYAGSFASRVMRAMNVTFPSPGVKGGALNMHGTLTMPDESTLKKYAAVFIHGSGPNDRSESFAGKLWNTDAKPNAIKPNCGVTDLEWALFTDLTQYFVANGIATLAYDKRDCCRQEICKKCVPFFGKFPSTCYYACTQYDEPQQLNLQQETPDDIAMDAASALLYLQKEGYENLIVVGHSEGVGIAPAAVRYYLNMTSNPVNIISHMVLLGGTEREIDSLMIAQYQRINDRAKTLESACQKDPSAPYSQELIQAMKNIEKSTETMIPALTDFFAKFRQGQYPLDYVYNIGSYVTGNYLDGWIQYSNVEVFENRLRDERLNNINVMSINSPTDMNVHEEDYSSLIQALKARSIQVTSSKTNVHVIPNLTHYLTNASLTGAPKQSIVPQVAQSIVDFILSPQKK